MIFKERPLLIVLLLCIIIFFACLGAMKQNCKTIEGMSSETENVPLCSNSAVPGCYSTVMDSAIWNGTEDLGNNYILKTEIVPPVCPACPSVINQHSHDGDVTSENEKLSGSELYSNDETTSGDTSETTTNDVQNSEENNINAESNVTNITNEENIYNQSVENVNTEQIIGNTVNTPQTTSSGQDKVSQTMLDSYEKTINDLKGQIKELQQTNSPRQKTENGECPPCPAPERCPEPAFSCQKVINYRSPSVGQYLPMPVLNDFSTFNQN